MTNFDRLQKQLDFIIEIDKLKQIERRAWLTDRSRRENDAEHSWHLGVMAMLLIEHADREQDDETEIDLLRVMRMLMIHDLVEIDAGDTFAFDEQANLDKPERERCAADRIFGLLPTDQAIDWRGLWDEFEQGATPEARFAKSVDRLQPLLHNFHTEGLAWREHGVQADQVRARVPSMTTGCRVLGELAGRLIDEAERRGYFG